MFRRIMTLFWAFSATRILAATCCHTPTVWTIKNESPSPAILNCSLKKSTAWSGQPINMKTEKISAGGTTQHTWDSNWYSDGMGMLPGTWTCVNEGTHDQALTFSTDWGENITITWSKSRGNVARR